MDENTGHAKRLLVVDDDAVFRATLARAFERRGYDVRAAGSSQEALELCENFVPDRAIVDQRMGDGSGLDLLRQLKSLFPDIAVVILTGYGSIPSAVEATKVGAVNYLTKPAEPNQIEAAFTGDAGVVATEESSLDRAEWEHIQRVLTSCGGNVSAAARVLGIDRRTLQRRLARMPSRR